MTSPIVEEATKKFQEIEDKVREFFDKVNDVLSWVPGFLSDLIEPIEKGMDALRKKVEEFWARLKELWNNKGDPDKLRQVAADWNTKVGNAVGDIAGEVSLDKLQTNLDWQGRAAEAYKATVPAQVNGLNSVKGVSDQLHGSLENLANGLENFWTAMKAAAVVFAIGAAAAIIGVATIVGTPAAIVAILTAIGVSANLIISAITSMQTLSQTIATEQGNILQKVHDLGDKWAKSNTGAMQEKSDWHVMS